MNYGGVLTDRNLGECGPSYRTVWAFPFVTGHLFFYFPAHKKGPTRKVGQIYDFTQWVQPISLTKAITRAFVQLYTTIRKLLQQKIIFKETDGS